jgi:hypothetical protein
MQSSQIAEASKQDLVDELAKIKTKQKRLADDSKAKTEKVVEVVATVGAATGISMWLGGLAKTARKADGFDALSPEDQSKKLAEAQGFGGFDFDAIIGVAGVAIGMTDMAGSSSSLLGAIGTGALASYASRVAYQKAAEAVDEEPSA